MNIEVISAGKRHRIQAGHGDNLMECLNKAGLMEKAECGGRGVCGKCIVKVHSGDFAPATEGEKFDQFCGSGEILACRSHIQEDAVIELGDSHDDVSRKIHLSIANEVDATEPIVRKIYIEMEKPSLRDQLSDIERVLNKLPGKTQFAPGVLYGLPSVLRTADFKVTCALVDDELIAVEAGDTTAHSYGFIIDIGTTTVAIYLVDLTSGNAVDAYGLANPQRVFGADVLSRITEASTPEGLDKLHHLVLDGISDAMRNLCARKGIAKDHVYHIVVVGNTTMSHLFLGVNPANLAMAPFVPGYRPSLTLKALRLGLPMQQEGYVHLLANISGYVGSDTLGVAMATKPWEQKGVSLAVDIGTNGEILLGYKGWVLACSAAAGPAFEGAHIKQGMRAGVGAIEKVSLKDGKVTLGIIGNAAPKGVCGSGLIDAVAELLDAGILTPKGNFVSDQAAASNSLVLRLRTGDDNIREFVLAYAGEYGNTKDIVITQKDVRELQLAKAAIAAGIEILLKEAGLDTSKVDRLYLAGAFGNYLDKEKAVALGLFPGITAEKIIPIGNAAAKGAGLCLVSSAQRKMSNRIAKFIKPVELSSHPDFNTLWIHAMKFPDPKVQ